MARRNVFFVFELTFWPGVAMLSHGLLTRFLDLTPQMTAFILVGTVALSAVQVCQLDVAYAVLYDVWSKSVKHQFLAPIGVRHLTTGAWLVGILRWLVEQHVVIRDCQVHEPELEEVFVELAR